jgi:plasmid maintenance system antidote protein VapI
VTTHRRTRDSRQRERNTDTSAFLESLNQGPLTFGQLLSGIRQTDDESLARFADRLGISKQHLHQLEVGQKRVSAERAVRFARVLGQSAAFFLQLALQDLVNDSGFRATVEVRPPRKAVARHRPTTLMVSDVAGHRRRTARQ